MVSDKKDLDFLKSLPTFIHPEHRYALEGISFALDAIDVCYERIVHVLSSFPPPKIIDMHNAARVAVFSDAWTIIDRCHTALQLVEYLFISKNPPSFDVGKKSVTIEIGKEDWSKIIKDYFGEYEKNINALRNTMDHLRGNIKQLAKTKKNMSPIQGSISYIYSNLDFIKNGEASIVTLSNSTLDSKPQVFPMPNPIGRDIHSPIGCLELSANDRSFKPHTIDITRLYHDSMRLKSVLNTELYEVTEKVITRVSKEEGISIEALKADKGRAITAVAGIIIPGIKLKEETDERR